MPKPQDPGQYKFQIIIEKPVAGKNATGEQEFTWVMFRTVWADYIAKGGNEIFNAQHFSAEVDAVFKMRYISGLNEKMRIRFNGRLYNIKFINPIGRCEKYEVLAKAILD